MIQEMQISIISFFIYLMSTAQNERESICAHGNDRTCENFNLHKHVNT